MNPITQFDLIIFDLDDTLTKRYGTRLLPGRREFFKQAPAGIQLAIATNQGGVGLRRWLEITQPANRRKIAKYPTPKKVETRLSQITRQLEKLANREVMVFVAYAYQDKSGVWADLPPEAYSAKGSIEPRWQPSWRKPSPGMLIAAMAAAAVQPERTLFVGDDGKDRAAAEQAGCHFQAAGGFFKISQVS